MTMTSSSEEREVDILMPPRSLLILSDEARFTWKHSIKQSFITERRLCVTIRELSDEFVQSYPDVSNELFKLSKIFV